MSDLMFGYVELETPQEVAVIGHLRGWCHNSAECAICQAEFRARDEAARMESVITGKGVK
jgi:hypothetical protein